MRRGNRGVGRGTHSFLPHSVVQRKRLACPGVELKGNQQGSFNYAGICDALANFANINWAFCLQKKAANMELTWFSIEDLPNSCANLDVFSPLKGSKDNSVRSLCLQYLEMNNNKLAL